MSIECAYSFKDLFEAAFHREPTEDELGNLYALPQSQRNRQVREWAALAQWETRERVGFDGQDYIAFAPKF